MVDYTPRGIILSNGFFFSKCGICGIIKIQITKQKVSAVARSKEEKQLERKQRKKLLKEKERQKNEIPESFPERKTGPDYKKIHSDFLKFSGPLVTFLLFLVPAGILVWAYVSINPEMKDFRESLFWIIGSRVTVSALLIYLGFFAKEEHGLSGKIAFASASVLPWFNLAVSDIRTEFIAILSVFLIFVFSECRNIFFKNRMCNLLSVTSLFLLLLIVRTNLYADMIDYPPKYYIVPFVFGAICWILVYFLYDKGYISIPSKTPNDIIIAVFATTVAAMFFIMPAANYMFDRSEGTSQILVVEDKPQQNTKIRRYYITVNYNGKLTEIRVSENKHANLEIGDTVTVTEYKGFLGDGYLVVDEE